MINIPVVFTFDRRIILAASIAIKSLIDSAKETTSYDIRIFHSDLKLKDQKNLVKLVENTRHKIAFHYIDSTIFKKAPSNNHSWTEVVYYRFLAPKILSQYDKVIYSDVDVLFKDDLEELYNTDLVDYELGAVRAELNTPNSVCHKYFEQNKKEHIYWSGLLLFNCKIFNDNKILDKLLANAEIYHNELRFYDLDLMNITCNNIKPLDFKYCVLQSIYYSSNIKDSRDYTSLKDIYSEEELLSAKNSPAIVHYAGKPGKPWRIKNPYSDYKKYLDNLPKELRKYTFRDIRKKLFSKKIKVNEEKIFVIINGTTLGDTLLTNSLAQNIKQIFKNSKIVRVTNPELYDAVKYQECTDDVVIWERKGAAKTLLGTLKFVKQFPYKNIFAAFPIFGSDRAVLLSILLGAKNILFYNSSFLFEKFFKISKYPIIRHNGLTRQEAMTNLLMGITKEEFNNYPIKFNTPDTNFQKYKELQEIKKEYIVLAPVSSTISKDIPLDIVKLIIKKLKDEKIVLCGVGEISKTYSEEIRKNNYNNLIDLTNKTSIVESAEVLKNAKAAICVDTGIMHLSIAVNTPTTCVFNLPVNCCCPKKDIYKVDVVENGKDAELIVNSIKGLIKK